MRDGNLKWWCQYVVHGWAVSTSLPTPLSFLDIQILWPTSDLLRCGPETLWVNTISICVLSSPLANSGLPKWLSGKESACQCRRHFDPWVGKIPWRRKWQPTPVFLPGKSHGQRSLVGYSPRGCKRGHDSVTKQRQQRAWNILCKKWIKCSDNHMKSNGHKSWPEWAFTGQIWDSLNIKWQQ